MSILYETLACPNMEGIRNALSECRGQFRMVYGRMHIIIIHGGHGDASRVHSINVRACGGGEGGNDAGLPHPPPPTF